MTILDIMCNSFICLMLIQHSNVVHSSYFFRSSTVCSSCWVKGTCGSFCLFQTFFTHHILIIYHNSVFLYFTLDKIFSLLHDTIGFWDIWSIVILGPSWFWTIKPFLVFYSLEISLMVFHKCVVSSTIWHINILNGLT